MADFEHIDVAYCTGCQERLEDVLLRVAREHSGEAVPTHLQYDTRLIGRRIRHGLPWPQHAHRHVPNTHHLTRMQFSDRAGSHE